MFLQVRIFSKQISAERLYVIFFSFHRSAIRWVPASCRADNKEIRKGNRSGNYCLQRGTRCTIHPCGSSLSALRRLEILAALFSQQTVLPDYLRVADRGRKDEEEGGRQNGVRSEKTGRFFGVLVIRDTAYISLPLCARRSTLFLVLFTSESWLIPGQRGAGCFPSQESTLACLHGRYPAFYPDETSWLCYPRRSPRREDPKTDTPAIHIHALYI